MKTAAVGCFLLVVLAGPARATDVTWDTIVGLTDDAAGQLTGYGGQHSIAVDAGGNVHVAWLDQRDVPYQVWYRRYDAGTSTWLAETALTTRPAKCFRPGMACDSAGNVHLVWHIESYTGPGIWCKRYDAATERWKPDTLIDATTTLQPQSYPSVACVPGSGDVEVAWYGLPDTGISNQVFVKEWHQTAGWDSAMPASTAPVNHDQVSLAAGTNGDLAVVWCGLDFGNDYKQVFCRRRVSGVWQDIELGSDLPTGLTQYAPGVAFDHDGAIHVVWHGRSLMNTYQQVFYRRHDAAGWSGIDSISGVRAYQQQFPSIVCDATGRCHAVWCSKAGSGRTQLIYAQRDTNGVWSSPMILTGFDSASISYPSITCDAGGGIHIVWHDDHTGNQDVYYLHGVMPGPGVSESRPSFLIPCASSGATVVRNRLILAEASRRKPQAASLLSISGRRVMDLHPGPNDVGCLPAGVYFVVGERRAVRPSAVVIVR